jgi:hypothetical protein
MSHALGATSRSFLLSSEDDGLAVVGFGDINAGHGKAEARYLWQPIERARFTRISHQSGVGLSQWAKPEHLAHDPLLGR